MAVVLLLGMTGCKNNDNPVTDDIDALEQSTVEEGDTIYNDGIAFDFFH